MHASPGLRVGKGVGKLPRPRMCPGLSCVQPPRKVESGNPTKDNTTAARRRPCLLSWRQEHRLSPAPHPPSRGPDPRGRTGPPRRGSSRGRRRLHPRNLSLSLSLQPQPNAASPSPARTSRVQEPRNLGEEGLPSADRNNKATLLLTGPFRTTKSSAKDSSPRASKLQSANHRRALRARRDVRLLRH